MNRASSEVRPISESPWYWIYLFATAGLVALVLMGPKFSARQAQIERKYQARQRAAHQVVGQQPNTPLSSQQQTSISLKPLYVVLGVFLALAWTKLWWNRLRRAPVRKEHAA